MQEISLRVIDFFCFFDNRQALIEFPPLNACRGERCGVMGGAQPPTGLLRKVMVISIARAA
jgi:hypothetical protein